MSVSVVSVENMSDMVIRISLLGDMFAEVTVYWYGTLIDTKTMAMKEDVRICTISFPFHI
jgi:hypothetical protein